MWTHFWDMNSGGGRKEEWTHIYIEEGEEVSRIVFYNRFGHNADRVTCTCCGSDYSISTYETLAEATAYQRGCDFVYFNEKGEEIAEEEWEASRKEGRPVNGEYVERQAADSLHKYKTLEEFKAMNDVLVIYAKDIKSEEKIGDIPVQGYVWK